MKRTKNSKECDSPGVIIVSRKYYNVYKKRYLCNNKTTVTADVIEFEK